LLADLKIVVRCKKRKKEFGGEDEDIYTNYSTGVVGLAFAESEVDDAGMKE